MLQVPRETVIGLFRDLRGVALATNSRRTYGEQALGCGLGCLQMHGSERVCSVSAESAHGWAVGPYTTLAIHPDSDHASLPHPAISIHPLPLPVYLQACCSTGCTLRTSPPSSAA